jgi:hypothetical protein
MKPEYDFYQISEVLQFTLDLCYYIRQPTRITAYDHCFIRFGDRMFRVLLEGRR